MSTLIDPQPGAMVAPGEVAGEKIRPAFFERLTPKAKQLLGDSGDIDAVQLLNLYADLPSRQQTSLTANSWRIAGWAIAIAEGNTHRVSSHEALEAFNDFMYDILTGDTLENIAEQSEYTPREMTDLQNVSLLIEQINTARRARFDTLKADAGIRNAEIRKVLEAMNALPPPRRQVTLFTFRIFGEVLGSGASWETATRTAYEAHLNHPLTLENGPLWSWSEFEATTQKAGISNG